jgi:hypothetical protein
MTKTPRRHARKETLARRHALKETLARRHVLKETLARRHALKETLARATLGLAYLDARATLLERRPPLFILTPTQRPLGLIPA